MKTPIYGGVKIQATVHNAGEYTLTITRKKATDAPTDVPGDQTWDLKAKPETNGLLTFDLSKDENETVQAGVKKDDVITVTGEDVSLSATVREPSPVRVYVTPPTEGQQVVKGMVTGDTGARYASKSCNVDLWWISMWRL